MRVINFLTTFYSGLNLKTKLILSYILIIMIPTLAVGINSYNISSGVVLKNAQDNIHAVVKKSNMILDQKMRQLEENTQNLEVDHELFDIFNSETPNNTYQMLITEKKINEILFRYFPQYNEIYQTNIVTSYYTFKDSLLSVSPYDVNKSELYKKAVDNGDRLQWMPTYYYPDMFNSIEKTSYSEYPYLYSAIKLLNCSCIENGFIRYMSKGREHPVLIVSFKEEVLRNIFKENTLVEGSYYEILTKQGEIVSHSDSGRIAEHEKPQWLKDAIKNGSGSSFVTIDGRKMLVCYDTLKTTGWISALVIPVNNVLSNLSYIRFNTISTCVLLMILAFLLAYFISGRITIPIKKLLIAIQRIGEGEFSTKITISQNDEMGFLVRKFNEMNENIQALIEANYESKIKEKEAEIQALYLQLNPHFLYNTLNIINWVAMENNQAEISKLIVNLSTMLQYTVSNKKEIVEFAEDFEWLKSYIYIMDIRFEGKFSVRYDIDPALMAAKVPKLFLQPLVENAIIHGLEMMKEGGEIKVSARIEEDKAIFCVEDNGIGFSAEKIDEILNKKTGSIGVSNIHKRIKLLYGEAYGVSISSMPGRKTAVTVVIPLEKENLHLNLHE